MHVMSRIFARLLLCQQLLSRQQRYPSMQGRNGQVIYLPNGETPASLDCFFCSSRNALKGSVPLLTVLPEGSVGRVLGFRGVLAEALLPDVPFFSICALKGSVPGISDGAGVVSV